tara:strand:- start:400 stop:639 length:240 start_codon:yes stop_codon:yes gene_type:complete
MKLLLAIIAILLGMTLGVLMATFQFFIVLFRFPMDVYRHSVVAYDAKFAEVKASQRDIWKKHIERMDKKYGRDGENKNL